MPWRGWWRGCCSCWTVKPPNSLRTCSASAGPSATSGGIGALSFGKDPNRQAKCTRVGAVDTGSGKLLWHKDIGDSKVFTSSSKSTIGAAGFA
ncbi:hypothetical protein [Streptomyces sp. MZ04]|uniref:hypothetical protein n=1 Tax=Streptomyces sp. MZ04 TaxID=2559236 RepID=UPI00107EA39E|nr:hypothetical protein [Streptomyces sp. MZ04]TGA96058.1 hypothetical protein E2651_32945 [Streptomyces sp. MZ04]